MDKIKNNLLFWIIGLLFTIYLIIRAVVIPVTIDEAGTFFNAVPRSVWDILTYTDPVPNNHIVNTLLIKLFVGLFGVHAFVIRLPNILGFILYYSIAVIWLKKINTNTLFVLCGIAILTCNPFLLEFFALARGYGLSISFMFVSLFYIYLFLSRNTLKHLAMGFGCAALSVYANFTLLNFYMAFFILICLVILQKYWIKPLKQSIIPILTIGLITGLLALGCYLPLHRIVSTNQLQYWGTTGFFADTMVPLVNAMKYSNWLLPFKETNLYVFIYILLFIIVGIYAVAKIFKVKFNFGNHFLGFSFLILCGTISSIILQFYIFGTPLLNPRGAIFLYVLFVVPLIFLLQEIFLKPKIPVKAILIPIIIVGFFHFCYTANFKYSEEWWFDQNTKQILSLLKDTSKEEQRNITLNTSWLFNGSFQFHILEQHDDSIILAPFHKELWVDSAFTYYYCEKADFPVLEKQYHIYKTYGNGNRLLLKRNVIETEEN